MQCFFCKGIDNTFTWGELEVRWEHTERPLRSPLQMISVTEPDSIFSLDNTPAKVPRRTSEEQQNANTSSCFHKRDRVFQRAFNEVTLSFARRERRRGGRPRDTTESQGALFFKELSPSRRCQETKKEGKEKARRGNAKFSTEWNSTIAENAK